MPKNYPHLNDTKFPDLDTENVYKYRNEFDYDRYKETVKIKMLNVSWCGDYENAVYFETKAERDEWFEKQEGLVKELPTMFRLYSDGTIKVDLPIDECMDYNYLMIDYGKLPQQDSVSDNSKLFYFINDVAQASPNATTLMLSVDYWTSFINDMDISYVNLLRGHAPMAMTDAETYLDNPIENSEYLLTSDVNYGEFQRVTNVEPVVFNDSDVLLGFVTNGWISGYELDAWNNRIGTRPYYAGSQGLSAVDIIVLEVTDFENFRDVVSVDCPQFFETVKGIFVIPRKLISINNVFTFCGFTCYYVDTKSNKTLYDYSLTKDKFGYPENISDIAKLYTYPYSAIEVNDFKGNSTMIKVEDTVGDIKLNSMMCDLYPFLSIETYMLGIGSGVNSTVSFKNVLDSSMEIGGRYYNFTNKWHIPIFAVQLTVDQNWTLNTKIGADAAKQSAYANAATAENNAALQVATNTANTTLSNDLIEDKMILNNAVADVNNTISVDVIGATANNDIEAAEAQATNSANVVTTTAGNSATSSMINSGINGIAGIATGAMSGAAGGPVGAGLGAAMGAMNAITGMATSAVSANTAVTNANTQAQGMMNSMQISNDLRAANVGANTSAMNNQTFIITRSNVTSAALEIQYNTGINANNNALTSGSTLNSANTTRANADRSWNAAHDQTMLNNPPMFGSMTGTPDIISKPFGLSYNIVTQSKNAIRQAAEQFLRYGYALNMQWNIDTFNKMPKFTYWLCDVVYCNDNGVYEGAQNEIKRILNNGVTVWRNPEEIGLISIYENGGSNV